ncbi:MAG: TIGR03086 family metal-binding protein [Actinomycetota bacterium]
MTLPTTTLEITYVEAGPLPADDPRLPLAHAAQLAQAIVARIDADVAGRPTPCGDWDVVDVARHVVGIFRRVAGAPSGADPHAVPVVPDIALPDLADSLAEVAAEVHAAWTDPATLDRPIDAPWGTAPGAVCLLVWSCDVVVHAWDLARALDLEVEWPPSTALLADVLRSGLPADGRDELPFGDVVAVAADAPAVERLVAWTGRDPAAV